MSVKEKFKKLPFEELFIADATEADQESNLSMYTRFGYNALKDFNVFIPYVPRYMQTDAILSPFSSRDLVLPFSNELLCDLLYNLSTIFKDKCCTVLLHMILNRDKDTNLYDVSDNSTAYAIELSNTAYRESVNALCSCSQGKLPVIKRIHKSLLMVSPLLIVNGEEKQYALLRSIWDKLL